MSDLMAGIKIFFSNFNAAYGRTLAWAVPLAILAVLVVLVLRAAEAGARGRRLPEPPAPTEEADRQRLTAELQAAVRIPSVSGEEEQLALLREELRKLYPTVFEKLENLAPQADYLLLRWPGSGKKDGGGPVLLCAHMDVVPVAGDWGDRDPFGGEIDENDCITGRGSIDCKGTLTMILDSAEQLLKSGFRPQRDIYLAFGQDEEVGGAQGAAQMARLLAERNVHFDLVLDEGTPIYRDFLDSTDFPAALIALGEKGCCNYQLTARGKAGHASVPPRHTAVGILAEAVCRVESTPPPIRRLPELDTFFREAVGAMSLGKRFVCCNFPFRGALAAAFRNDRYVLPLLRTTLAVTQARGADAPNVLPGEAVAVINCRLLPGDTPQGMLDYLRALVKDLPVTVEMIMENPASPVASPDSEGYKLVTGAMAASYGGLKCIPTVTTVATDSRHYQPLSDTVLKFCPFPLTKEEYSCMHGAPERMPVESLAQGARFYRELMKTL